MSKQWVHRHNRKAENLIIETVTGGSHPGQLNVTLSYTTEGTKLVKVDRVTVPMDLFDAIHLVDKARGVIDNQILQLQYQRSQLG